MCWGGGYVKGGMQIELDVKGDGVKGDGGRVMV